MGPLPSDLLENLFNPHICQSLNAPTLPGVRTFDAETGTFMTGLLPELKRRLREMGIRHRIRDLRSELRPSENWSLAPGTRLRDYQARSIASALNHDLGIISAGTGAGKTLIGAAIIAALRAPTIWITTTRVLQDQALADLQSYLGVRAGRIGAGTWRISNITVALIQSLISQPHVIPAGYFKLLIFDEGHHSAAPTYRRAVLRIDARRNYFLTAVPERPGPDQAVLESLTGGIVSSVPTRRLVRDKWLCPVEVRFSPVTICGHMTELQFATVYKRFIVRNEARNSLIAQHVRQYACAGEAVLVLTDHIEHGQTLLELFPRQARFVHGRVSRRQIRQSIQAFRNRELPLLVATCSLFAEGINIVGTSCIVFAGGLRSKTRTLQAVGRGMRLAPGKTRCIYQDYLDQDELGLLLRHSKRRLAVLDEAGFETPEMELDAPSPQRAPLTPT